MRSLLIVCLLILVILLIPFVYAESSFIEPADTETNSLQKEVHIDDAKTDLSSGFRYNKDALIVLKKEGKPKVAIIGKFGQKDVDLSSLIVRTEGKKTLVTFERPSGVGSLTAKTDPNFAIFVPNKNGGAGVYVCSGAKTLEETNQNCACKIEIKGPLPLASSASVYTINGITAFLTDDRQNYVIYGLTGTVVGLLELSSVNTLTILNIWDDTDSERRVVNENVGFYGEYTNLQSLLAIQNADCKISLPQGQTGKMTWNSNKTRYEYFSKFNREGQFTWNATCVDTSQGNDPASDLDQFFISSPTDSAPKVTLITPTENQAVQSNSAEFSCSATDDQQIKSMSLYLDDMSKPYTTKQFSGRSALLDVQVNGIPQGNHKWNCEAVDSALQKSKGTERSFSVVKAVEVECKQDWSCDSWSNCIGGKQKRVCTDKKFCFSQSGKPTEEQTCESSVLPADKKASKPVPEQPFNFSPIYSLIVTLLILVWLLFLFYKRRKKKQKN